MVIDKFYLDEARRIRIEYLKNLEEINKRVPFITKYKDKIESYKNSLQNILDSDSTTYKEKERTFFKALEDLNKDVITLENEMQPFYKAILTLKDDSEKLKDAILEKYVGITIDEIQKQIIPHVADLYPNNV